MDQISLFLKKYENLGFKDLDLKRRIKKVLKEEIGLEIKDDDIQINERDIRLNVSGAPKTELFLKKSIIEQKINDNRALL